MENRGDGSKKGLVLVYTGDGKGKTTAALGLALRAIGHGQEVYMIQFMKGPGNEYGERKAARDHLKALTIVPSGRDEFVNRNNPSEVDLNLAARGMDLAREVVRRGQHGLVILDEVNVAVDYGLVKVEELLDLIRTKPDHVNMVLTGRGAREEIVEIADTISEVKEIKHHYRKGIPARKGIEF